MSKLLEVENLRVRFRIKSAVQALIDREADPFVDAVHGVSLSVGEAETFGLVGEKRLGENHAGRFPSSA